jgi:hypothetical protein
MKLKNKKILMSVVAFKQMQSTFSVNEKILRNLVSTQDYARIVNKSITHATVMCPKV